MRATDNVRPNHRRGKIKKAMAFRLCSTSTPSFCRDAASQNFYPEFPPAILSSTVSGERSQVQAAPIGLGVAPAGLYAADNHLNWEFQYFVLAYCLGRNPLRLTS